MDVLFTFSGGTEPPVSPNGIYGFGINFSLTPAGDTALGIGVNGASVASGSFGNGFAGVIASNSSPAAPVNGPIYSARFSFQAGSAVTVTGVQYAIVPAPATLAAFAAGLGAKRRRRSREG
jgi:hypothetical protein